MPGFRSVFSFFHHLVSAKLGTSSIRVKQIHTDSDLGGFFSMSHVHHPTCDIITDKIRKFY